MSLFSLLFSLLLSLKGALGKIRGEIRDLPFSWAANNGKYKNISPKNETVLMDVYKLKLEEQLPKAITKENFERDTLKSYPWYRPTSDPRREGQFAICPACDNPIQLIGLYHLPPNVTRPYGKHHTHGLTDLASDDSEARENCPYFKPRQHEKTDRKKKIDGMPLKILRILVSQFDRVIYLLEKCTHISFSKRMIRQMLIKYRGEQGYLYTGATLTNIPWIFAYMSDSQPLFGQRIGDNKGLVAAIEQRVRGAEINGNGRLDAKLYPGGKKDFIDLSVCFIGHRQRRDNEYGSLKESMEMVVYSRCRDKTTTIYKETIEFDHHYFQALTHLPANHQARRPTLVSLATEVLGDICR